ncbi:MAG TPA: hypothetical protein VIL20_06815 [Sandaracinaceae bacterium]
MFRLPFSVALLCVFQAGCTELREPAWDVVLDPALDAEAAVVRASIRRGGCTADPDDVLYEQQLRPRPDEVEPMPELDDGWYCFEAIAEDERCAVIAEDAQLVDLPLEPDARIVNRLERLSSPRACDGICTSGGCRHCDEDEVRCDGPARCCPAALGAGACSIDPSACRVP